MQIEELRSRLRGELIEPQHPAYETHRVVYNAAINKRPKLIVRCRDAADVIAGVRFAGESGLILAVRGGGHSGAGLGVCNDGVVVDLSPMRGVRVDPLARTVRVEGGALLGDVDHATYPFGLSVPSGVVSTTGVGGLTLGGGHGYLTRRFGLSIDNLLEADLVLADGRQVTASAEQNRDLFWAIRGGGGNFGAVTSFLFRAHPVSDVFAGPTFWPIEQTTEVMQWYREFASTAPEELYAFFLVMNVPPAPNFPPEIHGRPVCGVVWCYSGDLDKVGAALEPLSKIHAPLFRYLAPMPLPALNSMFDPLIPAGLQWYWKGHFVRELTDQAIAQHAEFGPRLPSLLSTMHLYPIDGAASRVSREQTAFSHREARWSMVIGGIDPDPANYPRISAWARDYWKALEPHSVGAGYVNFMQEEDDKKVKATYRDNYPRLVEIKTRYDPHNLFCVNWNIAPAVTSTRSP